MANESIKEKLENINKYIKTVNNSPPSDQKNQTINVFSELKKTIEKIQKFTDTDNDLQFLSAAELTDTLTEYQKIQQFAKEPRWFGTSSVNHYSFDTLKPLLNTIAVNIITNCFNTQALTNIFNPPKTADDITLTEHQDFKNNLVKIINYFPDQQNKFAKILESYIINNISPTPDTTQTASIEIADKLMVYLKFKTPSFFSQHIEKNKSLKIRFTENIISIAKNANTNREESLLKPLDAYCKLRKDIWGRSSNNKDLLDLITTLITNATNDGTNIFNTAIPFIINAANIKDKSGIFNKTKNILDSIHSDLLNLNQSTIEKAQNELNKLQFYYGGENKGLKSLSTTDLYSQQNIAGAVTTANNIIKTIFTIASNAKSISSEAFEILYLMLECLQGSSDLSKLLGKNDIPEFKNLSAKLKNGLATYNSQKLFEYTSQKNIKKFEEHLNNGWGVDYKLEFQYGNNDTIKTNLLNYTARISKEFFKKFLECIPKTELEKVINSQDDNGATCLMHAIQNRQFPNAKSIIDNAEFKKFTEKSKKDNTALKLAGIKALEYEKNNNNLADLYKIIKQLREKGCKIDDLDLANKVNNEGSEELNKNFFLNTNEYIKLLEKQIPSNDKSQKINATPSTESTNALNDSSIFTNPTPSSSSASANTTATSNNTTEVPLSANLASSNTLQYEEIELKLCTDSYHPIYVVFGNILSKLSKYSANFQKSYDLYSNTTQKEINQLLTICENDGVSITTYNQTGLHITHTIANFTNPNNATVAELRKLQADQLRKLNLDKTTNQSLQSNQFLYKVDEETYTISNIYEGKHYIYAVYDMTNQVALDIIGESSEL